MLKIIPIPHPPIPALTPTICWAVTGSTTRVSTRPAITTNKVQKTLFTCSFFPNASIASVGHWTKIFGNPDFGILSKKIINGHCSGPINHGLFFKRYKTYPPPVRTIVRIGSEAVGSEFCPLNGEVIGVEAIVCCFVVPSRVICVEGMAVGIVVRDNEFAPIAYRFLSSLPI